MFILKRIIILCCIGMISSVDAMKREYETYDKRDELISFKKLAGLPLVSWDNLGKWTAKLSKKELQGVRKQIKWRKDDRLKALFHMRALAQDIKRLIAAHVLKSEAADYKKAADIFCTKPLCDVLEQYALSTDIFQKPDKFSFVKECLLQRHVFFEYAHDLMVYQDIMNIGFGNFRYCSKKELEILAKVNTIFGEFIEQNKYYPYQFRNKISFDLIKQCCEDNFVDQTLLFPVIMAVYMIFMFPFKMDCIRDQGRVEYNEAADEVNKAIQVFNNKVSYLKPTAVWGYSYKSYVEKLPEYPCAENITLCRTLYGLMGGFFAGISLFKNERDLKYNYLMRGFREENILKDMRLVVAALIGMGSFWKAMSYIASQTQENSLHGVVYVTGLYALFCSCYNIYKVQRVQNEHVFLKNIPALLQRTDIEIV